MTSICRACLQEIENVSEMYNLSANEPNLEVLTLGQKLAACIPEMVLDITTDAVLCWSCTTSLRCAYGFRQQCLESEEQIRNYLRKTGTNTVPDLKRIIQEDYTCYDVLPKLVNIDDSNETNKPTSSANSNTTEAMRRRSEDDDEIILVETRQNEGERCNSSLYDATATELLRELLTNKLYKCQYCNYKTVKTSKFELHKRLHIPNEMRCTELDFNSTNSSSSHTRRAVGSRKSNTGDPQTRLKNRQKNPNKSSSKRKRM